MRKILIGVLVICLSLGLGGMAMGQLELAWDTTVEFGISGASDGASGVFDGSVDLDLVTTATSGPWSIKVEWEEFGLDDAYLTYTADAFELTMSPVEVHQNLYDVGCAADITLGTPQNPGVELSIPTGELDFFTVVNNVADGDDVNFNFAGGIDFSMDDLGLGLVYISDGEAETNMYGGEITYSVNDLDLTAQYGSFSPDDGDAGTGYYFEAEYAIAEGTTVLVSYAGADDTLNSADGVARDVFSEIYGEIVRSLADNIDLTIDVTSTDDGLVDAVTAWEVLIGFAI